MPVVRGKRTTATAIAVMTLALLLAVPAAAPAAPRSPDQLPAQATVPGSLADRYLVRHPALGPVTAIDISGESNDRKLLAATLQGIVNRTTARIYLLGARSYDEDKRWLDSYQSRGLITLAATVDLDTAIHTFKGELAGYVEASTTEPWTLNTATSVAGALGGVVATPQTVGVLQSEGLTKLADHRGRWSSAAVAYEAVAKAYRSKLPYQGVAIEKPDVHAPRDLFVQQGVFVLFTRPSAADYDRVYDLIETFPTKRPVYGYISDTGAEEIEAIVRLSKTGRFLVPTDTTDNLSFHLAVGGSTRTRPAPKPTGVAPCRTDTVNVVISISDGDNLVIPESYYQQGDKWNSPRRGELPIGWGLSPAASVLMPAIWDTYVGTTTGSDEIVDIMGLGYSLPSLMPDGASFVADNMRLRAAVGLHAHWALDALISKPDAEGWSDIHDASVATGLAPDGMMLNYETWTGPAWFHTVDGMPVLASRVAKYESTATDIAGQIQTLVDEPDAKRPLVNFFASTVWYASYETLADAMAPLQAAGVRFLTPSEAFACLPAAPATTTTTMPASTTTTAAGATTSTTVAPPVPAEAVAGSVSYTG